MRNHESDEQERIDWEEIGRDLSTSNSGFVASAPTLNCVRLPDRFATVRNPMPRTCRRRGNISTGLLTDIHRRRFSEIATDVAPEYGCDVSDINGEPDHVHILFRAEPTTDLTAFVKHLKGLSSRRLREELPSLKRGLSALWQPGYFLCTTGQVTFEDLKEYVENQ